MLERYELILHYIDTLLSSKFFLNFVMGLWGKWLVGKGYLQIRESFTCWRWDERLWRGLFGIRLVGFLLRLRSICFGLYHI